MLEIAPRSRGQLLTSAAAPIVRLPTREIKVAVMPNLPARFCVLLVLVFTSAAVPAASPKDLIETLHATLLETMQQGPALGLDGRFAKLQPVLTQIYDFRRMTEVATGSAWNGADDATRTRLTDAFARMSVMTYASRFANFAGERFEVIGDRPGPRDSVYVDTVIHRGTATELRPGEEPNVPITYVVAQREGQWRIVDVLLEQSISELAVRRSEYSKVLREGGIERLIDVINQKTAQLQKD
jgi:phospholipid transport system substrate-binding protein